MLKKRLNLALMMLLIYLPSASYAKAEKWYHVEVLIFENKDKQALAEEWPLNPGLPSLTNAINLSTDPAVEFGKLSDRFLALTDAKQKIQKNYHVVLHKAWRQIIQDKEHAQKIHLVGGKDFGGQGAREVEGILRLSSRPYLHVDADLLLRKPMKVISPSIDNQAEPLIWATFADVANRDLWQQEPNVRLQSFRLQGANRVHLEEIQYIDHPLYGMIIMVTPEKTDAKKPPTTRKIG